MGAMRVGDGLFVGIETLGAAYFAPEHAGMMSNVRHVLRDGAAALNMLDFIRDQFWRAPHTVRCGNYLPEHCLAPEEDIDSI